MSDQLVIYRHVKWHPKRRQNSKKDIKLQETYTDKNGEVKERAVYESSRIHEKTGEKIK